jgi:exopolyphosphatase/guanosine-5'-triphosphate,3'-diphosphate pyrophosphatase
MSATLAERTACLHVPETTYRSDVDTAPVRVCVIDLGTNSFHAVIVDVFSNGSYQVVDRMKEMVRLGQSGLQAQTLPEDAMERGMRALRRIELLARGWDTREFLAFATSAIREARNGGAFIERVREDLGLRIRPISGEQEARLIYRGVQRGLDLSGKTLLVDIGGGSVECIVVAGGEVVRASSHKIGAARMTERFVHTDPMAEAEKKALRETYAEALEPVFDACRAHGIDTLVGSSGTMKSIARVCVSRSGDGSQTIFQQDLPTAALLDAAEWVVGSSADERRTHPAIEPKRVDQIGAGALLVETICSTLPGIERMRASSNALREGMVVHFVEQNDTRIQRMVPFRDVRRRSVHEIAFRFDWEQHHAQHVAATALFLFEVCRPIYDGPAADRELIEYAALLHDIGYHVSHAGHHKHSGYLIRHANLQGFHGHEVDLIALVARYHRAAFPKDKHKRYGRLSRATKRRVRQMAALLRIAEGLDRSHFQNVLALRGTLTDEALTLGLETRADPQLEVWSAEQEGALFRAVFDRDVQVDAATIDVEQRDPAPTSVTHTTTE